MCGLSGAGVCVCVGVVCCWCVCLCRGDVLWVCVCVCRGDLVLVCVCVGSYVVLVCSDRHITMTAHGQAGL